MSDVECREAFSSFAELELPAARLAEAGVFAGFVDLPQDGTVERARRRLAAWAGPQALLGHGGDEFAAGHGFGGVLQDNRGCVQCGDPPGFLLACWLRCRRLLCRLRGLQFAESWCSLPRALGLARGLAFLRCHVCSPTCSWSRVNATRHSRTHQGKTQRTHQGISPRARCISSSGVHSSNMVKRVKAGPAEFHRYSRAINKVAGGRPPPVGRFFRQEKPR